MPESLTLDEFLSAVDEIAAHKKQKDHDDCEFCYWMGKLPLNFKAYICMDKKNFDNFMYLYIGLKLGRRQAFAEAMDMLNLGPT